MTQSLIMWCVFFNEQRVVCIIYRANNAYLRKPKVFNFSPIHTYHVINSQSEDRVLKLFLGAWLDCAAKKTSQTWTAGQSSAAKTVPRFGRVEGRKWIVFWPVQMRQVKLGQQTKLTLFLRSTAHPLNDLFSLRVNRFTDLSKNLEKFEGPWLYCIVFRAFLDRLTDN
jgi:hypothetical protein